MLPITLLIPSNGCISQQLLVARHTQISYHEKVHVSFFS